MEKKWLRGSLCPCRPPVHKMLLAMKWTFVFTVLLSMNASAGLHSQDTKVNLDLKGAKLKKALDILSKKGNVRFMYTEEMLPASADITLSFKETPVMDVVRVLLSNTGLQYKVMNGDLIILSAADIAVQDKHIKGKVTDEKGGPIPGATIRVVGATTGTTSAADGSFEMNVPENAILSFQAIGFEKGEVRVSERKNWDIVLKEETKGLNEVVVVGYGTQKRTSITGAVASVSGKEIESIPTSSLSNALAGRLPGAQIVNNSGFVGANSDITIRGVGSPNGGFPLVVIDGIVATRAGFDVLDPNEVETVSILKDAASAAIYGSRSSNGVIVVTTKAGKLGAPVFNFKSFFTTSRTTRPLQSFSAIDELTHKNNQHINLERPGNVPYGPDAFEYYKNRSYNLMDMIWQNPVSQQHNLSVNGGTEQLRYFMMAGFNKASGSFRNTDYDRYNFRAKVDAKINKYLDISMNISGNRRNGDRFYWPYDKEESLTLADFYRSTFNASRLSPFYMKADGTPAGREDAGAFPVLNGGFHVPELLFNGGYRKVVYNNFNGILKIDLQIPHVPGLSTTVSGNYNVDTRNAKAFVKHNKAYFIQYKTAGPGLANYEPAPLDFTKQNIHNLSTSYENVQEYANFDNSYQLNWFLNYARKFGMHDVSANLVYEQAEGRTKNFGGTAYELLSSNIDQILAASTDAQRRYFNGEEGATARISWIGRVHYEFDERYIAEFSFRRDGSYIFAPGKRFGFFPSVSAAWRISREKFFQVPFVDELKLRASYGSTGNDNITAYQWQNNYWIHLDDGGSIDGNYVFGSNLSSGLRPKVLPNPDVTWEKATTYNAGFDFSLFKGKVVGEFDYFTRKVTDILTERKRTVPGTLGATLPFENYASKDVKGFEASIQYKGRTGEVDFTIGANMGYAKDKWLIRDEASAIAGTWRSVIGQPDNRIFGFVSEGILRDQAEVDKLAGTGFTQFGRKPTIGTILYKDIRGANYSEGPDGKIDFNDQTFLSDNAIPRINFGINLGISWKGFSIDALFQGVGAYDKIIVTNNTKDTNDKNRDGGVFQVDRPYFELWKDAWSVDNPNGKYPKIMDWGYEEAGMAPSNFWIRNGAYLRLRNLNVAYNIPRHIIKRVGMRNLQLFFTGNNLFVMSKFKETDPEQAQLDSYPIMKSYTGGININF